MKKIVISTASGFLLMLLVIIFVKTRHNQTTNQAGGNVEPVVKIVSIDDIAGSPDSYQGFLGVEGTIIETETSRDIFLLGCRDSCITLPVKYAGKMPTAKNTVIAYGEIKRQPDGKFIFEATEVKLK